MLMYPAWANSGDLARAYVCGTRDEDSTLGGGSDFRFVNDSNSLGYIPTAYMFAEVSGSTT